MSRKTEEAVIKKITERGDLGEKKYGVTLDRRDLTPKQWMQHFQEEMLDGAQYAERCIEAEDILEEAIDLIENMADSIYQDRSQEYDGVSDLLKKYKNRFNA